MTYKLEIRCGFQSGCDIAAARAAKKLGLKTSGWMPKGWKTEDGPRPEYADLYGAKEHSSPDYPPRTHLNAAESDLTIWFGQGDGLGYVCTQKGCRLAAKPFLHITGRREFPPETLAAILRAFSIKVLNCAGNRLSKSPGIDKRVEDYLTEVFKITNV